MGPRSSTDTLDNRGAGARLQDRTRISIKASIHLVESLNSRGEWWCNFREAYSCIKGLRHLYGISYMPQERMGMSVLPCTSENIATVED